MRKITQSTLVYNIKGYSRFIVPNGNIIYANYTKDVLEGYHYTNSSKSNEKWNYYHKIGFLENKTYYGVSKLLNIDKEILLMNYWL